MTADWTQDLISDSNTFYPTHGWRVHTDTRYVDTRYSSSVWSPTCDTQVSSSDIFRIIATACNEVWTMQNVDIKCLSWVRPPAPVTRRHTSVNHTRTNLSPAPPPCTWTIQLGWLSISLCPGKYRNFWWFHLRHVIICHNASKQLKCLLEHQQSEIIIRFSNKLGLGFMNI